MNARARTQGWKCTSSECGHLRHVQAISVIAYPVDNMYTCVGALT